MDQRQFDAVAKLFAQPANRRGLLAALLGVASGTIFTGRVLSGAAADTPAPTPKSCANQVYAKGKHFSGDPINADSTFFPSLDQIDACAGNADVTVVVTNSYRPPGTSLSGTVVDPATQSNHAVGHAIDMNVSYTDANKKEQLCNSSCLGGADLPKLVKDFVDCVKKAGLRWGGDFATADPVHVDDGLNVANPKRWQDRKTAMNDSTTCAACEPCNLAEGVCTSNCEAGKACDAGSGQCKASSPCPANVVINANGAGVCR